MARVAIVGTGIAGLSCAHRLIEEGVPCVLFDKGRQPGGRMATRVTNHGSYDHGAQYFTARSGQFREVVEKGIQLGVLAEWRATFGEYDGKVWQTKSPPQPTRYVGTPTMNRWACALAENLTITQSFHVQAVQHDADGWRIRRREGEVHGPYEWLVITTPAPQASALLAGSPLEHKLRTVSFAPSHAVLTAWTRELDAPYDGAFINSGPLSWVARNTSKPGRPPDEVWILHSNADWSRRHIDDTSESVIGALLDQFESLFPARIPAPRETILHRWLYAIPTPHEDRYLLDPSTNLLCAGDYCAGPRVEGAYLSGLAAAEQIVARA